MNGSPLATLEMGPGDREYRWRVPRGIWVDGTNELVLETSATTRPSDAGSPDARELGVAVTVAAHPARVGRTGWGLGAGD